MTDREQVVLNGRYELHRRVGRGGMAEVYLARDRLLDRLVAIKILFPEFATDPSFVARFRREAQAAANLNHPNIVGVYDWGKERGTYYIVMEYVDGRPVSDMIRSDGPLDPKKAAAIAADVAGALGFAHRKGVVHRDVKPGNVLITKAGEVKVADFGIARAMTSSGEENLTQTGSVMGTATYFSPEQAQGKPVDARTDLYSLGVVLYEMVAGKPPFSGDSPVAIAYQHVQEPIPPLAERAPGVPGPYEAIVMRALAKDADARYPDGAGMRADLLRFRDGRPISPGPAAAAGVAAGAAAAAAAAGATSAVAAVPGPGPAGADGTTATGVHDGVAPNKRTGWFFVVIIFLMVILGGLLVVFGNQLGIFDEQTKSVTMPRVIDKQVDEATDELKALKLEVEIADREDEAPVGTVLEQSPAAGDQVEEGRTVVLTVSVGIGSATVPEVDGLTEELAIAALEEAGFTNRRVELEEAEDGSLEGFVLRSNPTQGQVVRKNTLITLFVATAPAPTTTAAPVTTTRPPTTVPQTTTTSPPATTTTIATTTTTAATTTTTGSTTSTTVAP